MTDNADIMPSRTQAAFPKAARLLKTDEFSSVFRLRPWRRSAHFVVYGRQTDGAARLGLVIGKKYAPRAVTRNLVRSIAREAFRVNRAQFDGFDLLLRLHTKFDRKSLPGASSPPLKALWISGRPEELALRPSGPGAQLASIGIEAITSKLEGAGR